MADAIRMAELFKFAAQELEPVVRDELFWYTEVGENAFTLCDHGPIGLCWKGDYYGPLAVVVDQQEVTSSVELEEICCDPLERVIWDSLRVWWLCWVPVSVFLTELA